MRLKTLLSLVFGAVLIVNGKCPTCTKSKWKSTLYFSTPPTCRSQPPMGGSYDTVGRYHPAGPASICTRSGKCSRGHEVLEVRNLY